MGSSEGDRFLVMAATNRPEEIDDAALRLVLIGIIIAFLSKTITIVFAFLFL